MKQALSDKDSVTSVHYDDETMHIIIMMVTLGSTCVLIKHGALGENVRIYFSPKTYIQQATKVSIGLFLRSTYGYFHPAGTSQLESMKLIMPLMNKIAQ